VIINSPHNPTGRIYPAEILEQLAHLLASASRGAGRPIYLVSDESYSRIVFDNNVFVSPARFYPYTFVVHTYSKSTLAPGQRLGYVALPASMPDRPQLRLAFLAISLALGTALPDAVMQYALPELERLPTDVARLQRKRDRLLGALREQGYQVHTPQATFYLLPRCPMPDDAAFAERLARDKVVVLPGRAVELPGYLRLSLTATEAMIERALPVFGAAIDELRAALRRLPRARSIEGVRGHEGAAGRAYFAALPLLLQAEAAGLGFSGRTCRPPRDPFNSTRPALPPIPWSSISWICFGCPSGTSHSWAPPTAATGIRRSTSRRGKDTSGSRLAEESRRSSSSSGLSTQSGSTQSSNTRFRTAG
jgi:hypothetical protein